MQWNRIRAVVLSGLMVLAMAGVASAHAVVYPKQVGPSSYEKFSLRVPSEKEIPTTQVKVEIPEGFEVSRVQPVAGWKYAFTKTGDKVTAITWSGGEIAATEFQEFVFQGKTPKDAGKFAFRAYQTYKDGTVVEWTGASDAKTPASFVEVKAAAGGAATDAHGTAQPAAQPKAPEPAAQQPAPAAAPQASGGMTPIAAYGGLALGAAALAMALRRR